MSLGQEGEEEEELTAVLQLLGHGSNFPSLSAVTVICLYYIKEKE